MLESAKVKDDIEFYYLENKMCKRRSYIHNLCETYDVTVDRCTKCYSKNYIEITTFTGFEPDIPWKSVHQPCRKCDGKYKTNDNATCEKTDGLKLVETNTFCNCVEWKCNNY